MMPIIIALKLARFLPITKAANPILPKMIPPNKLVKVI